LTIGIVLYLFAANFFERVIEKFSVTRAAKRLRRDAEYCACTPQLACSGQFKSRQIYCRKLS